MISAKEAQANVINFDINSVYKYIDKVRNLVDNEILYRSSRGYNSITDLRKLIKTHILIECGDIDIDNIVSAIHSKIKAELLEIGYQYYTNNDSFMW